MFVFDRLTKGFLMSRLTITTFRTATEQESADLLRWKNATHSERLDEVERLRLEAGKFLYDYPARLQRVVTVTRREPR